jgi:hypothetical protein
MVGPAAGDEVRLGLFRIAFDEGTNAVQLDGDTFDQKGQLFGQWKSVAIAFQVKEGTLFFLWEGTHPTISPGDTFTGFGHYVLEETAGMYDRGNGEFADIHRGGRSQRFGNRSNFDESMPTIWTVSQRSSRMAPTAIRRLKL